MTTLAAALFGLSLFGGFCSGLLGVGGAVVLIPLCSPFRRCSGWSC